MKLEFLPILDEGRHSLSLAKLKEISVTKFDSSERRRFLFGRFESYLDEITSIDFEFDIWVDGSFLTLKDNPEDIDVVVIFDQYSANGLADVDKDYLEILLDNQSMKSRYNIDVYAAPSNKNAELSYWNRLLGTERDDKTPKGYVVINDLK